MKHRLLLIGRGPTLLPQATRDLLESLGYFVDVASMGEEALEKARTSPLAYSLAILELDPVDDDGIAMVHGLATAKSDLPILVYSADPSRQALLSMWNAGAAEFIEKNGNAVHFLEAVHNWSAKRIQTELVLVPHDDVETAVKAIAKLGMVGRSAKMHRLANEVDRYRTRKLNVLILGESGTGKEKVAMALHANEDLPFLAVNCASYNGDTALMEAELFGAERGSYTGSVVNRRGIFYEASGGTVFLDEVHTLCVGAQQKLLRVLQEKKVRPLGTAKEVPVSFRLIASAKPNLEDLVRDGEFLPDLFFRLHVLRIDVPPLRERPEDISPLVDFFCRRYCETNGEKREFLPRTIRAMERYAWPGNIRELENAVERLCARTAEDKITPEHFDGLFRKAETDPLAPSADTSFWAQIDRVTYQRVTEALRDNPTHRQAAAQLGIPHSTFHGLVRRLGISPQRPVGKNRESR